MSPLRRETLARERQIEPGCRELKEKKEDKEKITGYTNKPTITIPEEPKNIKGVCWMCFDNVTDTQKRVKAKKNGVYHYSHYDCQKKSISKKTQKSNLIHYDLHGHPSSMSPSSYLCPNCTDVQRKGDARKKKEQRKRGGRRAFLQRAFQIGLLESDARK